MSLHLEPPLTPRGVLLRHRPDVVTIAALAIALAVLGAVNGGSVLLVVDEPIQRWVEAHRTPGWERVVLIFSRLGSNLFVFSAFAVLVVWAYRRCRTLALTLSAAVLVRPVLEFLVKELIGRDRPDFDRLVTGSGPSMPSGHVLAAVALWGLLPPLVAAFTHSRALWWATVVAATIVVTGVAASRVYLGVHWFTDLVEGFLLGSLYLVTLEVLFAHHHRHRSCPLIDRGSPPAVDGRGSSSARAPSTSST
jgi:undecaprenyl-diphosphatase